MWDHLVRAAHRVAPLVGAWIEIIIVGAHGSTVAVAPLVGAWIEIALSLASVSIMGSLPLWERGLKSAFPERNGRQEPRRSPCGSVD